jgi:transcriptional regulator GlxA family with amidase domain
MIEDIAFALFDGFAATDAVGPADVFMSANQTAGAERYRLRYLALAPSVRASNGMVFAAEALAALDAGARRSLFVPGADEAPLLRALDDAAYVQAIMAAASSARRVCSVCSGAFLLARAGLLKGRRAATHWRALDRLAALDPSIRVERDALYVEDGPVWTSAGVTAGIDMALAIVERDLGRAVAIGVAREMVLFLVRPGGQSQFSGPLDLQARAINNDLRALPPWLEARLDQPVSVAAMAEAMAMSERSFHRRCQAVFGLSPLMLLNRLRLDRARALIEDTSIPLKSVAAQSGLGDMSAFGKAFRRQFGVTPAQYRTKFGAPGAR